MALKNTYSKLPVSRYLERIENALILARAIGINKGFEDGRITSLSFGIKINEQNVGFKLPIAWKKVQQVLKNEQAKRWDEDDYAYRVSWAIVCDWIEAQMAILASETVTVPQLFLPYAIMKNGKTLSEGISENPQLLLA